MICPWFLAQTNRFTLASHIGAPRPCDVRAPDRDGGMRRHSHPRAAAAATRPRTPELLARTRMVFRGLSRYRVLHQQRSELWPVWQLLQSHIGIVQRSILRMRAWCGVSTVRGSEWVRLSSSTNDIHPSGYLRRY